VRSVAIAALAALAAWPGGCAAAEVKGTPGLSVRADGTLLRDGGPWRGIGVNYFDLFYRTLKDPADTSYEAGLKALAERGIPFARFMCGGYWPSENRLYQEDKEAYFRRLDAVVKAAEKHGVGLVPSLFWHLATVPDLVGEPVSAWGDPKSRTHAFMRTYTREVVTRYRDSPAVWGWEFGNEYDLPADLPNAADHRPPVVPDLGTPASRSARDEVTHEMVRTAFAEFAKEVRRHDPARIIASGNAFPRATAWHQRAERSWKEDTPEQSAEMLLGDNPDPMNVLSVHWYQEPAARLEAAQATAARARKPLFVGEVGVPGAPSAETRERFAAMIAAIERCGVPLAALWVYDYAGQDSEWNVTATNARAYQLEAVSEANRRMKAGR
jgi:hypothetical protein